MNEKYSWRFGTQHELCECTECHDRVCHEHPWTAFSVVDRAICRVRGHEPSDRRANVVACRRRCGYVMVVELPRVTVIQ